jgi:DNA-directed RNA polymerase subunit RPC12/RpoP
MAVKVTARRPDNRSEPPHPTRTMPDGTHERPLREATCPYCERRILVHEEPPHCPLCACPLEEARVDRRGWSGGGLA